MLSQLFPKAFKKFLSLPLFGPVVEEWATWLEGQGYTWSTRRLMFRTLSRVDCHFSQRALHKLDELSQQDLDGCWKTFHRCRPTEAGTVRVLGRFLQARGLLRPALLPEPSRIDRRLHVYLEYLTDVRGFGASTLNSHQRTVREFLAFLDYEARPERLTSLCVEEIERFLQVTSQRLSRATLQHVVAALRGWLRFLVVQGTLPPGLEEQIDTPRCYRLENLPRFLPWETVEALLQSIDQTSPMGLRDYAIFFLMATYGLRNSEIVGLTLDDVDWRGRILQVQQFKTSAALTLPLTHGAAGVLFRYLKRARPVSSHRQLFLRVRAPAGPLKPTGVAEAFQRCARLSGLSIPFQGAHCLRHSYAIHLLGCGTSLKSIGDLLGHRNAESTAVYLRLATEDLRQVALAVPRFAQGEVRS